MSFILYDTRVAKSTIFLTSAFVLRASFEKKTVRGDVCAACHPVVGRAGRAETEIGENFVRFLDEFARLLYNEKRQGRALLRTSIKEDPKWIRLPITNLWITTPKHCATPCKRTPPPISTSSCDSRASTQRKTRRRSPATTPPRRRRGTPKRNSIPANYCAALSSSLRSSPFWQRRCS